MSVQVIREKKAVIPADVRLIPDENPVPGTERGGFLQISHSEPADGSLTEKPQIKIAAALPPWRGGRDGEDQYLRDVLKQMLETAEETGAESVLLQLKGFVPRSWPQAASERILLKSAYAYSRNSDLKIIIDAWGAAGAGLSREISRHLKKYLDRHFQPGKKRRTPAPQREETFRAQPERLLAATTIMPPDSGKRALADRLSRMEESFSQMLLRLIDEHGLTDTEFYRRANLDRRLFSKIRCNPAYRPSKETALACAIGLGLNKKETVRFLRTAGFALSSSSRSDIIVEYFIDHGLYDWMDINAALAENNEKPFA